MEPEPEYKTARQPERKAWRCPGCGQPMPGCYVQDKKLYFVTEEVTVEITGLAKIWHNSCDSNGKREWHTSQEQFEELMRTMKRLK